VKRLPTQVQVRRYPRIEVRARIRFKMTDTLIGYRAVWKQKAVLRILCNDIFERIAGSVVDGTTLELD
jgi:hypothetical protein